MKLFIKDLLMMYNGSGTEIKPTGGAIPYRYYLPNDGVYRIEIVGGGGGRVKNGIAYASGASGGGYVGEIFLEKGYYRKVTGGDIYNSIKFLSEAQSNNSPEFWIIAYNGGSAYKTSTGAAKGEATNIGYQTFSHDNNRYIGDNTLTSDGKGNDGTTKSYSYPEGGASVYNGYGKGWGKTDGTDGYFRLTYLRKQV